MTLLNISIVLYQDGIEIQEAINSVLDTKLDIMLYLVDNSETDKLKYLACDSRITYIFNNANLGYGSAHNIVIRKTLEQETKYHLVMNPDVNFERGTLEKIVNYMDQNDEVGSLMPKVLYADGTIQRLCKLLPTPLNLIGRRFLPDTAWSKKKNALYELQIFNYDRILHTPSLSGCFMFIRSSVLLRSGIFDERFFMYLEDYDLNRRINQFSKTIFYPMATIVHGFTKESYKSGRLLKIHMQSAIKYFNKWGWFTDHARDLSNDRVLKELGQDS
jgi:GT2 family glycosyltransferase